MHFSSPQTDGPLPVLAVFKTLLALLCIFQYANPVGGADIGERRESMSPLSRASGPMLPDETPSAYLLINVTWSSGDLDAGISFRDRDGILREFGSGGGASFIDSTITRFPSANAPDLRWEAFRVLVGPSGLSLPPETAPIDILATWFNFRPRSAVVWVSAHLVLNGRVVQTEALQTSARLKVSVSPFYLYPQSINQIARIEFLSRAGPDYFVLRGADELTIGEFPPYDGNPYYNPDGVLRNGTVLAVQFISPNGGPLELSTAVAASFSPGVVGSSCSNGVPFVWSTSNVVTRFSPARYDLLLDSAREAGRLGKRAEVRLFADWFRFAPRASEPSDTEVEAFLVRDGKKISDVSRMKIAPAVSSNCPRRHVATVKLAVVNATNISPEGDYIVSIISPPKEEKPGFEISPLAVKDGSAMSEMKLADDGVTQYHLSPSALIEGSPIPEADPLVHETPPAIAEPPPLGDGSDRLFVNFTSSTDEFELNSLVMVGRVSKGSVCDTESFDNRMTYSVVPFGNGTRAVHSIFLVRLREQGIWRGSVNVDLFASWKSRPTERRMPLTVATFYRDVSGRDTEFASAEVIPIVEVTGDPASANDKCLLKKIGSVRVKEEGDGSISAQLSLHNSS